VIGIPRSGVQDERNCNYKLMIMSVVEVRFMGVGMLMWKVDVGMYMPGSRRQGRMLMKMMVIFM
jgi:hypothetical protein